MSDRLSHGRTRVPSETVDHAIAKGAVTYQAVPVAALPESRPETPEHPRAIANALCPECGAHIQLGEVSEVAQRRILELEAEVNILTNKATTAADKLADYEDELRKLRASQHTHSSPPASVNDKESEPLPPVPSSGEDGTLHINQLHKRPSTTSRFSSFLTRRSNASINTIGTVNTVNTTSSTSAPAADPTSRETDLATELATERAVRLTAEAKVTQMNAEIEELSSSLFQQANEMVASERRARAKLEEKAELFEKRCGLLEERVKMLEKRDKEKKGRLEVLEEAMGRSERVRRLLREGGTPR